jgi:uncharacterized protein
VHLNAREKFSMKIQVVHNPAKHRFEADLGDEKALLEYATRDGVIDLTHTEVPPAHQNQGIGEQLVRFALNFAKESSLEVVPSCPFVANFISEHPEFREK